MDRRIFGSCYPHGIGRRRNACCSSGTVETFPIELKSNMTLYLESGAELVFIQRSEGFPVIRSEFEGRDSFVYMSCIYAKNAENVTLCGHGTGNCQGSCQQKLKFFIHSGCPILLCTWWNYQWQVAPLMQASIDTSIRLRVWDDQPK